MSAASVLPFFLPFLAMMRLLEHTGFYRKWGCCARDGASHFLEWVAPPSAIVEWCFKTVRRTSESATHREYVTFVTTGQYVTLLHCLS